LARRGGAVGRRSHHSPGSAGSGGGPRPVAVLIDASILIEVERGRLNLESHVAQRQGEEVFLSVITASELLHGVHRAGQPEVRTTRAAFVEGILARFPLLPVELATARAHAQVWAALMAAGQMIGPHDLWLAATCIAHGLTMVTANIRGFARVPRLHVDVWGGPG